MLTVKWLQVLIFNTNNSIQVFIHINTVKCPQILLSIQLDISKLSNGSISYNPILHVILLRTV